MATGYKIPWDDVPEGRPLLPNGLIKMKLEVFEEKESKSRKVMIIGHFRCVEPKQVKNLPYVEFFVLGTEDDPQCKDPSTFAKSVGMGRLKTLLKKAQVRLDPNLSKTLRLAEGHEVIASVTTEVDDGTRDPKYKGQIRNRVTAFFAVGERPVVLEAPAKKAAAEDDDEPVAPKKKAAPPPDDDDDDDDEEEDEEDEGEEEDDEDDEEEE